MDLISQRMGFKLFFFFFFFCDIRYVATIFARYISLEPGMARVFSFNTSLPYGLSQVE